MRGTKLKFIGLSAVLLCSADTLRAKEWRGVVPLRSTRADVERRFGKPDKWGDYQVKDERVSFEYADTPCKGLYQALGEDNCKCLVDKGTVMSITVEPTVKRKFSDLQLDVSKFSKTAIAPFPFTFMYVNEAEGIDYTVDQSENEIKTIDYYASSRDCQNVINSRAPNYKNSWRGLIPLHASRRDVERLLGTPQRVWETSATYQTDHEIVTVKYASGKCGESDIEWNAPKDTIIELVVGQRLSFPLSQLNLNRNRYDIRLLVDRDLHVTFVLLATRYRFTGGSVLKAGNTITVDVGR